MKKKLLFMFGIISLFVISFITVKAIVPDNPLDEINVSLSGEITHGSYEFVEFRNSAVAGDGYLAKIVLGADPGYYVKNFKASFEGHDLALGSEAASEHGGFFRETAFYPGRMDYEFVIPSDASDTNKVEVSISFAKKAPFTINYKNYTANKYENDDINNLDNYGESHLLVENYMDGDLVLPEDCTENGCLLEFQFANLEDYNSYKNAPQHDEDGYKQPWFEATARIRNDLEDFNTLVNDECDEDALVCRVKVLKRFNELTIGYIHFGYTDMVVFSPNSIGFDASVDIQNFQDTLTKTGESSIVFSDSKLENELTIFYGTKRLYLEKKEAKPIINDGANNCGHLGEFDEVIGEGYGYEVEYNAEAGVVTVKIDSYYQDKMTLELNILKNGEKLFDKNVNIVLNRFAFGGNAFGLLEVDSVGRNCREQNNGNTCNQGIYYSIQYRGVLSAFYVAEGEEPEDLIGTFYDVIAANAGAITLEVNEGSMPAYKRNKEFNPHAIALYYDEDGMIVETKTFELNDEVYADGFVTKETFEANYGDLERNIEELTKNYVFFGNGTIRQKIKDLEYFEQHINQTIMHDMILIGKNEAKEKGIVKIALFLVNGEVEEDNIPELTYGTGEGLMLEIRGEE